MLFGQDQTKEIAKRKEVQEVNRWRIDYYE